MILKKVRNVLRHDLWDYKVTVSSFCSARCESCLTWRIKQPKYMSFETFKEIVKDAVRNKGKVFQFHFYSIGESTLNPLLQQFLNYACPELSSAGIRTVLVTNGCQDLLQFDLRMLDHLVFSFNGFTKEKYEANTKLNWDKVLSNMAQYLIKGKKAKLNELHILNFYGEKAVSGELSQLFPYFNGVRVSEKVDNQCGELRNVVDDGDRTACDYVTNTLTFDVEGNVLLCSHDFFSKFIYGNVWKGYGLKEHLKNSVFLCRVAEHKSGVYEDLCEVCNYNLKQHLKEGKIKVVKG